MPPGKAILRSTSWELWVHEPNHIWQYWSSNGKLVTSIEHEDLKMVCGYQDTVPSARTTTRASRAAMSVSALQNRQQ